MSGSVATVGIPALGLGRAEPSAPLARAREAALSTEGADDRELIARAQKGDEAAFRELVERYKKRAYWVAYNVVGDEDDARDIAQEAFIRVFRSLASFDSRYKFFTWLYRIVTNLAVDALRRRGAQKRLSIEEVGELEAAEAAPHDGLERAELRDRVAAVLRELPANYRAVIVLREIEGFSSKEIAGMVGSTHATVRWRLHRARSLFRAAWERLYGPGAGAGGEEKTGAKGLGHEM
jgi:RNA polymerase sigma-70 factor (ECF subfamily)